MDILYQLQHVSCNGGAQQKPLRWRVLRVYCYNDLIKDFYINYQSASDFILTANQHCGLPSTVNWKVIVFSFYYNYKQYDSIMCLGLKK